MRQEATLDTIRSIAIFILASFPQGIKQSNLFKLTEKSVLESYSLPSGHAIKNALWNLDEKFPDLVRKEKLSYRLSLIYPTKTLIEQRPKNLPNSHDINGMPNFIVEETGSEYSAGIGVGIQDMHMDALTYKLHDIQTYIEMSGIDVLVKLQKKDIERLTVDNLEMIFGIKLALDQIKGYKNELMQQYKNRNDLMTEGVRFDR